MFFFVWSADALTLCHTSKVCRWSTRRCGGVVYKGWEDCVHGTTTSGTVFRYQVTFCNNLNQAMIAITILFALTTVITGQYVRPYSRYYNPRYPVQPYDYRNPDAIRDYRLNALDETPKPYSFSYVAPSDVGPGQSSRTETADGSGRVQGSYSLTNEEGHTRVVDYVADHEGFRAAIRTDEPGTDSKSPASVDMQSTAPLIYGPGALPYVRPYRAPYVAPHLAPHVAPYVAPHVAPYVAPHVAPYVAPHVAPYVAPAVQPVVNALDDPVAGAVEDPINDPLGRQLYRRPYNYNRNIYPGSPYRRGYLPNYRQNYPNSYNRLV